MRANRLGRLPLTRPGLNIARMIMRMLMMLICRMPVLPLLRFLFGWEILVGDTAVVARFLVGVLVGNFRPKHLY